ncbi:hypothetical protein SADUNF_Sadunf04G0077800 [Salix dunnii]|uniref:Uncharacterized protein n=1 Tax=Salix dunnii TaxID=1413687 RepID=A0A835KAP5_9ROSI|nr:hypothetical protein SADUNF_Sadunf04G0077800 [Salix dunnii]
MKRVIRVPCNMSAVEDKTLDTCKLDYGSRVCIMKINVPKPQHKDRTRMNRKREGSAISVSQATHSKHSDEKKSMGPWNQIISWSGWRDSTSVTSL